MKRSTRAEAMMHVVEHDTFTKKLLVVLSNSNKNGPKIKDIALLDKTHPEHKHRVLDARFAMGADNGAYLRSNVMPVHSAEPDGETNISRQLSPQVERAGRMGLLTALSQATKSRADEKKEKLAEHLRLLAYLLSIPEVYEFVSAQAEAEGSQAHTLLKNAGPTPDVLESLATVANFETIKVRCEIVRIVLMMLEKPLSTVEEQIGATLGENGQGTRHLCDGINRLALAARISPAVRRSDDFPAPITAEGAVEALPEASTQTRQPGTATTMSGALAKAFHVDVEPTGVSVDQGLTLLTQFLYNAQYDNGINGVHREEPTFRKGFTDLFEEGFKQENWFKSPEYTALQSGSYADALARRGADERSIVNYLEGVIFQYEDEMVHSDDWNPDENDAQDTESLEDLQQKLDRAKMTLQEYERPENVKGRLRQRVTRQLESVMKIKSGPRPVYVDDDWKFVEGRLTDADFGKALDEFSEAMNYKPKDELSVQLEYVFAVFRSQRRAQDNSPQLLADSNLITRAGYEPFFLPEDYPPPLQPVTPTVPVPSPAPPQAVSVEEEAEKARTLEEEAEKARREAEAKRLRYEALLRGEEEQEGPVPSPAPPPAVPVPPPAAPVPPPAAPLPPPAMPVPSPAVPVPSPAPPPAVPVPSPDPPPPGGPSSDGAGASPAPPAPEDVGMDEAGKKALAYGMLATFFARLANAAMTDADETPDAQDAEEPGVLPVAIASEADEERALDGICASTSQLREDGGVSRYNAVQLERMAGISPFWQAPKERLLQRRRTDNDYWRRTIWQRFGEYDDPVSTGAQMRELHVHIDRLMDDPKCKMTSDPTESEGSRALTYALVRGLCGYPGPHQIANEDSPFKYSLPSLMLSGRDAPLAAARKLIEHEGAQNSTAAVDAVETQEKKRKFCHASIKAVPDFVVSDGGLAPGKEVYEKPRLALWAPVRRSELNVAEGKIVVPTLDNSEASKAVAEAAVHEHLVHYYKRIAENANGDVPKRLFALACAAATKVRQLKSMASVAEQQRIQRHALCNAFPLGGMQNDETHFFFTRPVYRKQDVEDGVMYPCDAGLAAWSRRTKRYVGALEAGEQLGYHYAKGRVVEGRRTNVKRVVAGNHMLRAISRQQNGTIPQMPPLYIGGVPGHLAPDTKPVLYKEERPKTRKINPDLYNSSDRGLLDTAAVVRAMENCMLLCTELEQLECEDDYINTMLKQEASEPVDEVDSVARHRREAVWDDATREAAISGDRMYAFVRQLSGTISESVDAVCQIDEGMLVRQQQQMRERRARASDQAAREHMTLVRNVFNSVLRDSGLTLGISNDDNVGELKIVSGSLRKQAAELTQKGTGSEGFFSNAVRLEQLLESGTGEITINQLFERLQEAGAALQKAALSAHSDGGLGGSTASLDFLSAPRNSLILRYKPESLAAIRQAFDIFQREMVTTGNARRIISAFELVEGNDEQLCTAFATFSAHMLVHSRMYSSATALYIAAWPAAANAQQMKIALQRLVGVAANYLAHQRAPSFTTAGGREQYFSQDTPPPGGSPPYITGPRFGPQLGLWGLNMYGNR